MILLYRACLIKDGKAGGEKISMMRTKKKMQSVLSYLVKMDYDIWNVLMN
jgi:hypothetical protein